MILERLLRYTPNPVSSISNSSYWKLRSVTVPTLVLSARWWFLPIWYNKQRCVRMITRLPKQDSPPVENEFSVLSLTPSSSYRFVHIMIHESCGPLESIDDFVVDILLDYNFIAASFVHSWTYLESRSVRPHLFHCYKQETTNPIWCLEQAHNDIIKAFETKLAEYGIPLEEMGLAHYISKASNWSRTFTFSCI